MEMTKKRPGKARCVFLAKEECWLQNIPVSASGTTTRRNNRSICHKIVKDSDHLWVPWRQQDQSCHHPKLPIKETPKIHTTCPHPRWQFGGKRNAGNWNEKKSYPHIRSRELSPPWKKKTKQNHRDHREQNPNKHVQTRVISVDLHGRTRQVHVWPKAKPAENVKSQITSQRCVSLSPLPNHITSNSAAKKQTSIRSQVHKKSWQVVVMMNIYTQWTTVRMPPKSSKCPLKSVMS